MQEFVIAGCAGCHCGRMFAEFYTHVLSVRVGIDVSMPDEVAGDFAFRIPTLRQLEVGREFYITAFPNALNDGTFDR